MSTVVVTAADEPYAPLLRDLITSLEPHRKQLNFAIAVLDLGLAEATRAQIAAHVEHVVAPKWAFRPHAQFDADRRYLSRAARPFLPDLIRGYATYVWLDADTWVQHPLGLHWLIDAAQTADIAAVPAIHRAYTFTERDILWLQERYRMAFGEGIASELAGQPYINAGVFAMRAASRAWRSYAERFQTALDQWPGTFLSDQAVINGAIHLDNLQVQRLPARANWLCHLAPPMWNEATGLLVEPTIPFDPLLIVHNTFDHKTAEQQLKTTKGQPRMTRLTRSAIQSLRLIPKANNP